MLRGPGVREHQGDRAIVVADQVEALLSAGSIIVPAQELSHHAVAERVHDDALDRGVLDPAPGVGVLVDLAAKERAWGVVQLGRQLRCKGAVGQARGQAVARRAGARRSATSAAAACC